MTRRTTVIQPSTTTDALYTLANQPFKRRIISASIYGVVIAGTYHSTTPELKINDVEGNVLFSVVPTLDPIQVGLLTPINYLFAELGGSNYTLTQPSNFAGSIYFIPATIPMNLCVPACNLFTVKLWGSLPGDTLPNLVLVTEDDDDDLIY
jgi:hypothetical protein